MYGHDYFDAIADEMTSPRDESGRSFANVGVSRYLLGEVLSRVAVETPPRRARSQIARGPMPLSEGSVSKATAALYRLGLLDEDSEPVRDGPGRPTLPVSLGRTGWFSIGIHVHQQRGVPVAATGLAATLDDVVIGDSVTKEIPSNSGEVWSPAMMERTIISVVKTLLRQKAVKARKLGEWIPLLGVGVEIGRPVRRRMVIDNDREGRWHEYGLGEMLTNKLGVPVIVENDANALAVRETYGNTVSTRDFALVLVTHEGIGSAVVVDGRLYRGGHGMAGEIGHVVIRHSELQHQRGRSRTSEEKRECWCGGHDHVDTYASPLRLREELGITDPRDLAVLAAKDADDGPETKRAAASFAAAGRSLGQGLAALAAIVDPGQILLVVPSIFASTEGTVGAEYSKGVDVELRAAFTKGAAAAAHRDKRPVERVWEEAQFVTMGARAAAIGVLIEFIDHLRGTDGCVANAVSDEGATVEPRRAVSRGGLATYAVGAAFASGMIRGPIGSAVTRSVAGAARRSGADALLNWPNGVASAFGRHKPRR